jgi:hypothetical protein
MACSRGRSARGTPPPGRGALAGRLTRTKRVKGSWRQQMPDAEKGPVRTRMSHIAGAQGCTGRP